MNFGIPFKRPWGIPFGVPFLGSGTGGTGPTFPTAGLVGYYTPFDITKLGFSSANNVNLVVDQSTASNNLTQGTASANMVFNEHDTVTQFTSANQPTLVDTGGGVLAVGFDGASNLTTGSLGLNLDKWACEFKVQRVDGTSQRLLNSDSANAVVLTYSPNGDLLFIWDGGSGKLMELSSSTGDYETVIISNNNGLITCELNGVEQNTLDATGGTLYNVDTIGRGALSIDANLYSFKTWNSAVSTGTPNYELLPTVESCNVAAGQQVSRWNSTTHRSFKNRLLSDGSDDNYDGLPTQAGDFSYVFKCEFDIIAQTEYLLSDTGDSAWLLLSDNYLYLRDTTGANDIALTGHTVEAGDHVYIISREGDDLKYYVDSCLKQTVDVTGRTFTFSRVGATADSLKALNAEWGVWNRAFTQADVDYFSYLRNDDTNEILTPPVAPSCPTPPVTFSVNTVDLDETTQYLELQGDSSRLDIGTDTIAVSGWVDIEDANTRGHISKYNSIVASNGWFIECRQSKVRVVLSVGDGVNSEYESSQSLSAGIHHFAVYWAREGREVYPIIYVDGISQSVTRTRDDSDPTNVNFDNPYNFQNGGNVGGSGQSYYKAVYFNSVMIGQPLTSADATYLYNKGTPKCWDDIATDNPTLFAKFDATFDNGTYNGRTELQALTDHTNGWVLDNVNNAPFVDQGLTVECN